MTKRSKDLLNSGQVIDGLALKLFENIFDFFGTLDEHGQVLTLSGRIFGSTNTDPALLVGQRFADTVFWQSSANTARTFENAIEAAIEGDQRRLTLDFRLSAEEKAAVELDLLPMTADSGRAELFICGRIAAGRETESDRSENARKHLLEAAANAEIGLWYWDYNTDRIYSTPRLNELFDLHPDAEPDYETLRQTVHDEDRETVDQFIAWSRNTGTSYEREFRLKYPDGRVEWVCAEGRSFLDDAGRPQEMMGVLRKITDQKLAAEDLAQVHKREKLAREEAVEANRAKDFFLAFVSHELRSPLNAILGWSKILLTKKVDEATRNNALETIQKSARFQTKLINDLVDSARVASGKLRLEYHPTNLYEVIRNSFEGEKPAAEAKNIKFELICSENKIPVFGDAGRLQQVFGNLISNAFKFTPENGRVTISVKMKDGSVAVTVADTGQGIDPSALPNIFKQFSQGEVDQSKMNTGLGLGLSIVRILVTKHGGFVQAASDGPGKGSQFTVTLPLSDAQHALAEDPNQDEAVNNTVLEGVRILIVEDDPDSREVLQLFLEQGGANVTSADSAKAAIRVLNAGNGSLPDVLISDIAMPDEDGYSLIQRIRQMPADRGGKIPAMALSAFTSAESKQKAFDAGFDRYCTKPFEPDLLIKDVADLLGKLQ